MRADRHLVVPAALTKEEGRGAWALGFRPLSPDDDDEDDDDDDDDDDFSVSLLQTCY